MSTEETTPGSLFAPFVGREGATARLDVERGHVRRFVEAVGDDDAIYVDEEAARRAGHPRIPAPPTFAIALRAPDPREGIPLDWRRLLHGEQEFELRRPLYVGDRVDVTARIVAAGVKQGKAGIMDTMVVETRGVVDGELAYTLRATLLVRR